MSLLIEGQDKHGIDTLGQTGESSKVTPEQIERYRQGLRMLAVDEKDVKRLVSNFAISPSERAAREKTQEQDIPVETQRLRESEQSRIKAGLLILQSYGPNSPVTGRIFDAVVKPVDDSIKISKADALELAVNAIEGVHLVPTGIYPTEVKTHPVFTAPKPTPVFGTEF